MLLTIFIGVYMNDTINHLKMVLKDRKELGKEKVAQMNLFLVTCSYIKNCTYISFSLMFIIERIWVRFWSTRISYDLLLPRSNFFSEYVPLTQLKTFLKNFVCFNFIRRRSL